MMSPHTAKTAEGAEKYFERDNYYQRGDSQANSEWYGKGAEAMGLAGQVRAEDFHATLHGRDPKTGEQLVQVGPGGEHRPGVDCTFSAPKSASIAGLVEGDERVIQAHREAVRDAIDWMEKNCSQYRSTRDGEVTFQKADNLLAAVFHHDTSRAGDPQTHSHAFVHNMVQTRDGVRAMSNEEIYDMKMTAGAVYRASYATRLQKIGNEIERTHSDGQFEIKGYSRDQIENFSQRRAEIEARLKELGFNSARASEIAALDTRREKKHFDRDELARTWASRGRDAGIDGSVTRAARENGPVPVTDSDRERAAEEAVRWGADHLGERSSTWRDRALEKHAVQHIVGRGGDHKDVEAAVSRMTERGELIRTESGQMTTPAAAQREAETIEIMRRGQRTQTPLMSHEEADRMIERRNAEREAAGQKPYTPGQAEAIQSIVTSRDRVTSIEGRAGTGKTTAQSAVREEYEAAGYVVKGVAPSAAAARVLEDEAGIKSQTLASHLVEQHQSLAPGGGKEVWVVDEAGMVGTKDMHDLLKQSEAQEVRVVQTGDSLQLSSPEAGQPFKQLQENGMQTAKMEDIIRQKDPGHREAVDLAARGKAVESFDKLNAQGRITEIGDRQERIQAVAKDYLDRSPESRAETLVMTGTNQNRRETSEAIREGLKQEGSLSGPRAEAEVLVKKDMTKAQMREAEHYEPGDRIRFNRDYEKLGVSKGEYAQVERANGDTNRLGVRTESGRAVDYDPARFQKTEVYRAEGREVQAGDRIKFTRNDYENDRRNGETATVEKVDPERGEAHVRTDRGETQTIKLNGEKHWEHGYASTVHSAQGRTVRETIYEMDSRSQTTGPEAHYVANSRGQDDAKIYTDDVERAREAIGGTERDPHALDVAREAAREQEKGAETPAHEPAQSGDKGEEKSRPEDFDHATLPERGGETAHEGGGSKAEKIVGDDGGHERGGREIEIGGR